jgi:hypothetical protein
VQLFFFRLKAAQPVLSGSKSLELVFKASLAERAGWL